MGYDVKLSLNASVLFYDAIKVAMQDFSRMTHLCHYALETQALDGDVVELGCFRGDTAKLLTFITNKQVWLYDSFMGLPENNESCIQGAMCTAAEDLIANFKRDGLRQPIIVAGWFNQLASGDLPDRICFAHLDGDLYGSTLDALRAVYYKMVIGGVILIDDYEEPYFPGVKKACDEFFADKKEKPIALQGMNGLQSFKGMVRKQ